MPLIIDCCLYNGESILWERLDYLYDTVDLFILVEFKETHSGLKKPHYFLDLYQERLKPFASKLLLIREEAFPPIPANWQPQSWMANPEAWWRENYQRNRAYSALLEIHHPFILLGCDLDEIPRRELIHSLPQHYQELNEGYRLSMTMHYYSWQWVKKYRWNHPFVVNDIGLKQAKSLEVFRTGTQCSRLIPRAGWHCSYFMTTEEMVRKIEGFSHTEFNRPDYKNKDWVQKCIQEGLDLYNRGEHENLLPYNGEEDYPKKHSL